VTEFAHTVLLVDDDVSFRRVLAAQLQQDGIGVLEAGSGEEALRALSKHPIHVMIADLRMPGMGGMSLLAQATQTWPELAVVVLTAHGSVALAVEAMKRGATDFMEKPCDQAEVLFVVRKAMLTAAQERPSRPAATGELLLGQSAAMVAALARVRRAARSNATVLIRGETGTGKELVARAIHAQSERHAEPFIKLNCAALPDALLESELFGHEKGAFTGAVGRKPGRVELAAGGTLFLDEIGDVPLSTQVKLLRVLQERQFERVGGVDTLEVDVRFVAATHRPLEELVERGEFREDLFYRLNVIPVDVAPLRERREDIEPLVACFAARSAKANGLPQARFDTGVVELLVAQPWPGNVRQLENFVERLIVLSEDPCIRRADVERELQRESARARRTQAPAVHGPGHRESVAAPTPQPQRALVLEALSKSNDNRALAARLLGVSRSTLYNWLRTLGID
jgi:two-component system, NtrC family, response regulator AtoC